MGPGKDLLFQNRILQSTDQFVKSEESTGTIEEPDAHTAPSKFMVLKNTFFKTASQFPALDPRFNQSHIGDLSTEAAEGECGHGSQLAGGGAKRPKYTYFHQERIKNLLGSRRDKRGLLPHAE